MRRWLRRFVALAASAALIEALSRLALTVSGIPYDPLLPHSLQPEQREQLQALLEQRPTYLAHSASLGWTIRPNARSADGKNRSNAQGLRADREYEPSPRVGTLRVMAFGDSFTHCEGVALEDSWEERLVAMNPALEVINAGVNGFSLDQAFLRYEQESRHLWGHIVTIGFMSENINRVVNVFRPFYVQPGTPLAKPRFVLVGDRLELLENPIQTEADIRRLLDGDRALYRRMGEHDYWYDIRPHAGPEDAVAAVRLVKATWSAFRRVVPRNGITDIRGVYKPTSEAFGLAVKLFDASHRSVVDHGSLPLILLFPRTTDLLYFQATGIHRYAPLREVLRARGYRVLDLMDAFDRPAAEYEVTSQSLHFSAPANAAIARFLLHYLEQNDLLAPDGVAAALAGLPRNP